MFNLWPPSASADGPVWTQFLEVAIFVTIHPPPKIPLLSMALRESKNMARKTNQITKSSGMCTGLVSHTLGTNLEFLCSCYSKWINWFLIQRVLPPDLLIFVKKVLRYQGYWDKCPSWAFSLCGLRFLAWNEKEANLSMLIEITVNCKLWMKVGKLMQFSRHFLANIKVVTGLMTETCCLFMHFPVDVVFCILLY